MIKPVLLLRGWAQGLISRLKFFILLEALAFRLSLNWRCWLWDVLKAILRWLGKRVLQRVTFYSGILFFGSFFSGLISWCICADYSSCSRFISSLPVVMDLFAGNAADLPVDVLRTDLADLLLKWSRLSLDLTGALQSGDFPRASALFKAELHLFCSLTPFGPLWYHVLNIYRGYRAIPDLIFQQGFLSKLPVAKLVWEDLLVSWFGKSLLPADISNGHQALLQSYHMLCQSGAFLNI